MMYPYAPYFFNMFREIPWTEWIYENDTMTAKCNSKTPYVIIGGSACELFNKVYGAQLPEQVRLHAHTDPTGDIDVLMPGIVIQTKAGGKHSQYRYFSDNIGTMYPYTRSYTIWLLDKIEAYFQKLSYNFADWFPTAADFNFADDPEAARAEMATVRIVGPFRIYLSIIPDDKVDEDASMKIQVSMAHTVDGQIYHEHFIELLLSWDVPRDIDRPHPHIMLDAFGLIACHPQTEIQRNSKAIEGRIDSIAKPTLIHKIKNHFGRAIFLINLINLPVFYDTLIRDQKYIIALYYRISVENTANHAPDDAIKMIKECPTPFKEFTAEFYTFYKQLCEDKLGLTLEKCRLSAAPTSFAGNKRGRGKLGGGRKTRRLRRTSYRRIRAKHF